VRKRSCSEGDRLGHGGDESMTMLTEKNNFRTNVLSRRKNENRFVPQKNGLTPVAGLIFDAGRRTDFRDKN